MPDSPGGGWLLWRAVRSTGRRAADGWRATPRPARRRWLTTLLLAHALTAALSAALTFAGRWLSEHGMQPWDEAWLRTVERSGPLTFQSSIWLESFGNSAFLVPLITAAGLFALWRGRALLGLTVLALYFLHKPIVLLGWQLWDRARPDLIAGGIAAPPFHAYPSGHVVQAVAVYGFFAYLWMRATRSWPERGLAALLAGTLVGLTGLARIRLGAHWPSDELAALVIGLAWLLGVIAALRRAEQAGGR